MSVFTIDPAELKRQLAAKLVVNPVVPKQMQAPQLQQESGDGGMMGGLSNLAGSSGGLMDFFKGVGNGGRTFGTPNQKWDFFDNFSMGAGRDKAYADAGGFGPFRFADGGKVDNRSLLEKILQPALLTVARNPADQVYDKVAYPASDALMGAAERFGNYAFNPPSIQEEVKANLPARVGWGSPADDNNAERAKAVQMAQQSNVKPLPMPVDTSQPVRLTEADLAGMIDPLQASQAAIAQRNKELDALLGEAPVAGMTAPNSGVTAIPNLPASTGQPMGSGGTIDEILQMIRQDMMAKRTSPQEEFNWEKGLAALGSGMLASDGDFLDQLGAGTSAVVKAKRDVKESNLKSREAQTQSMMDYLKTLAYLEQVQKSGQMTPLQEAELQLKKDEFTAKLNELGGFKKASATSGDMLGAAIAELLASRQQQ